MLLRTFGAWFCKRRTPSGPNVLVQSAYGPIIINSNDSHIGSMIMGVGVWEAEEIRLLLRLAEFLILQNGSILFYDIGANIGQHSLALASSCKGKIAIRAFEPQPRIFQMLCGTMALNNLADVNCECALVTDVNARTSEVHMPDYDASNNFGGFEFGKARHSDNDTMKLATNVTPVRSVTVDSFNEHVHLMKIDVEGMEELVLKGALMVISKSRPICHVETAKSGAGPIRAFFDPLDYRLIQRGDNVLAIPSEWLRDISFLQLFPKTVE